MRISGSLLGASLVLVAVGCSADTSALFVDLRTDLVPGQEFAAVRVRVEQEGTSPRVEESIVSLDEDFLSGARVLEASDLVPGPATVSVELVATGDVVLQSRTARTTLRPDDNGMTIVMSRDCSAVTCPSEAEDPTLAACLGSRCVPPECTEETPELCGDAECASDSECQSTTACASGVCVAGACLFERDDAHCDAGEYCDADIGCTPLGAPGPWAPAVELTELIVDGSDDDDDPSLTGDLLELVFERAGELRSSTRASVDDAWSASEPVAFDAGGPPAGADSSPELSRDGLTLYFSRAFGLATTTEVYRSTRSTRGSSWSAPELLTGVNISGEADYTGPPTPDGQYLFLVRSTPMRFRDIFIASRSSSGGGFSDVRPLTGANTPSNDDGPSWLASRAELWFSSNRSSGSDIYTATVDLAAATTSTPVAVADPSINTGDAEQDPWIHPSGRVLFFSRRQPSGISRLFWTSR